MNWCCQDCCGQWQCRDPWGQLRKLGSESSSISLEELWRRVTVWNYLQHQEIQNRMRRERQAVASCWTINSFAFPKPKVGEAERERSIWLEAVGRVDGTEGLSLIYQTLTEKCKWRVSPALKKANSFLRIHVLHWYSLRPIRALFWISFIQNVKNEKILAQSTELADVNGLLTFCLVVCTGSDLPTMNSDSVLYPHYSWRMTLKCQMTPANEGEYFWNCLCFFALHLRVRRVIVNNSSWDGINFA